MFALGLSLLGLLGGINFSLLRYEVVFSSFYNAWVRYSARVTSVPTVVWLLIATSSTRP